MIETKFKKSEVGMIPEDWEVKSIGSLCKVNGRIGFRGYTKADLVQNGMGAYTIGGKHITHNIIDLSDPEFISWEKYYESPEIMVKKGDIVMAQRGTLGRAAYIEDEIGPATINPSLVLLNRIKCNAKYMHLILSSERCSDAVIKSGSQTSVPMISQTQIEKIELQMPPTITEQSRIAEALSDIDDLISTTKKLIETKQNIKEGAMQDLLSGKRRIKKFETDKKLKQTPIGFIPYNWEIDKIGEQFEFLPNNTLPREEMSDNGVVQNIHYGDVLIKFGSIVDVQKDDVPYISNPNFKPNYLIKDGDVIIADTAEDETVGKATEITNVADYKIVSGLHTMWLHPINKGRYGLGFLGYAFNARIYHNQLLPLMQGTKVTSISKTAIRGTYLVVPPKPEQEAIVSTLSAMDEEIQSLEARLTKFQSLKQGMMQQLLTGKIRLI